MRTTRIDDLRTPMWPVNPRAKVSTTFLLNASNSMNAVGTSDWLSFIPSDWDVGVAGSPIESSPLESSIEVRETTNSFMASKCVKNSVYFFE